MGWFTTTRILLLLIIFGLVAGLVVPPFFFERGRITALEVRYYVVVGLALFAVMVFGTLRLYNALYNVNRLMFALKTELAAWISALRSLNQSIDTHLKQNLKNLTDELRKASDLAKDERTKPHV